MSIRSKHQELAAKYHWAITPIATIVLGYLGVGEYKKYEAAQAAAAPVTITFEADSLDSGEHPHPYASSTHEHQQLIKSIAREAVNRQHEKDLQLFKQKEDWE